MSNKTMLASLVTIAFVLICTQLGAAAPFVQWAIGAEGSSQYGSGNWSFRQLLGEPDVYPSHGDFAKAWAPKSMDAGVEWVELAYAEAVIIQEIAIYETSNPGAIIKVEIIDEAGGVHVVWSGLASPWEKKAREFTISNLAVKEPARKLRITLDTSKVSGWNEIDAVSIVGERWYQANHHEKYEGYLEQWVSSATASSEYQKDHWAAKQMIGFPNVYPKFGDYREAWAPKGRDTGLEWVELAYTEAVYVDKINIYETCGPGAIIKVELIDESDFRHLIWEGTTTPDPNQARIFTVKNISVDVPVRKIVLTLDTKKVSGWNEIDAVQLLGWRNLIGGKIIQSLPDLKAQIYDHLVKGEDQNLIDPAFLLKLRQLLDQLFLNATQQ